MPIMETVKRGDFKVQIDELGGCHFFWPDDSISGESLSIDPDFMDDIEDARRKVLRSDKQR